MDQNAVPSAPPETDQLRTKIHNHIRQIESYENLLKEAGFVGTDQAYVLVSMRDYFNNIKGQLQAKLGQLAQGDTNV